MDCEPREQYDFGARLKKALRRSGFSGSRCVVGVPRGIVHVHPIRAPEMPSKELNESLAWEAAERFSIPREYLRVDGIRTGARSASNEFDRSEVVLFAMDDRNATPWLEAMLEAGLAPLALEPGFCGVARAHSRHCRREQDRDRVRVVLDVGAGGSTLVYLRGDRIGFCKTFAMSGNLFDGAVAARLALDHDSASALRRDRCAAARANRPINSIADAGVADAVKPLLHEIATEVALCLRHCAVAFRGARLEAIVLSGRDSSEPGLADVISERTGIATRAEDEDGTIQIVEQQLRAMGIRDDEPAAWAGAMGLALRPLRVGVVSSGKAA
jgi:type IV pilus assembly protein PilM